jgi:lipoprotein-anchoring transpeptidase ErfK/SrfK
MRIWFYLLVVFLLASLNGAHAGLMPSIPSAPTKGHTKLPERRVRYFYHGKEIIPPSTHYSWSVDESQPISRVEIRIGEQKLYAFQGDRLAVLGPVSTGKDSHPTPTGKFKVREKDVDHKSNLYGSFVRNGRIIDSEAGPGDDVPSGAHYEPSRMEFYMRLSEDGVGMHAGFLPGFAASHGCIRLPHAMAEQLYGVITLGTPVDIVP